MEAADVVREISESAQTRDGARMARLFCEDGVYHDVFYGAFRGHAEIADLVNRRFYESADELRWEMIDPVSDGTTTYARYLFSYRSTLPEAKGNRAMFEGVSILRMRGGLVAEYREVANTAPGFVDMRFAPERIALICKRQGDALKARPEAAKHLA
jgi:hypothetical protein